jgi:hypothetical protein
MRDPHVTAIRFSIHAEGDNSFGAPRPLEFTTPLGLFRLEGGTLTVQPVAHYPTATAFREDLDTFLRSWEVQSDIQEGIGAIRFRYADADLVDRDPPPPGSPLVLQVEGAELIITADEARAHMTRHVYPKPPLNFTASTDVDVLFSRYARYKVGREPLQAMAYFVLTYLQVPAGGRTQAAAALAIDEPILDKLGELAAPGDLATARKVQKRVPQRPLTGPETAWLEAAIKLLLLRIGELAAGTTVTLVTLKDLPPLAP